jgi:hypothetical protein
MSSTVNLLSNAIASVARSTENLWGDSVERAKAKEAGIGARDH